MKSVIIIQKLILALIAMVFIGAGLMGSASQAEAQPSWMPTPPKAIGGKCDADPKEMRVWHMKKLQHKRDETMRKGIRTDENSLKRCITCHAVKDESTNKFVTVKDERHFCRSCHDYAAVRIACFDCHASRPSEKTKPAANAGNDPHKMAAAGHKGMAGMSLASGLKNTALAALQKYMAGEGK